MEGIFKDGKFQYAQKVSPTVTAKKSPPPPKPDLELAKRTQEALQVLEIYSGKIDGIIGVKTRVAIRGWQTQNGYPATGAIDQTQIAVLEKSAIRYLKKRNLNPNRLRKDLNPRSHHHLHLVPLGLVSSSLNSVTSSRMNMWSVSVVQ